jgi:hypothetical protein
MTALARGRSRPSLEEQGSLPGEHELGLFSPPFQYLGGIFPPASRFVSGQLVEKSYEVLKSDAIAHCIFAHRRFRTLIDRLPMTQNLTRIDLTGAGDFLLGVAHHFRPLRHPS